MADDNQTDVVKAIHRHPDTRETLRAALLELVNGARYELVLCSPVLDPALFNSAALNEALLHFLTRHTRNRARLVVEDTVHMLTTCARLVELARRLSDLLLIRRLGESHHGITELFAVADGEGCLLQLDVDVIDATLDLQAPRLARPLASRFEDIWAASEPVEGLHGFRL